MIVDREQTLTDTDNIEVEVVLNFMYLGSEISSDGSTVNKETFCNGKKR